jgi:hypothetical protein
MNIDGKPQKNSRVLELISGKIAPVIFVVVILAGFMLAYILYHSNVHQNNLKGMPNTNTKSISTPILVTPPKGGTVLFSDPLTGPNRIVTNEYVHWSHPGCPYISPLWDMTSGTLMIKNQAGYTGIPTLEASSICNSSQQTNSAIFRLNTRGSNFGNIVISTDFETIQHGGGGAPEHSYDGVHLWARYQSEYALYAITVNRWDGVLAIKKKVPVEQAQCNNPSNDGCYYDLTPQVINQKLTQSNVWHHADVTVVDDSNGIPHIKLYLDGNLVLQAEDDNVGGAVYHTGAAGVRGDNTEFYFKNFIIKSASS